jgi:S-adenosylmethionine synthetase
VNTFDTGNLSEQKIVEIIKKVFPLRPAEIVRHLDLKKPIYARTAAFGHFGRNTFPWEKLDKVEEVKKEANL